MAFFVMLLPVLVPTATPALPKITIPGRSQNAIVAKVIEPDALLPSSEVLDYPEFQLPIPCQTCAAGLPTPYRVTPRARWPGVS